MNTQSHEQTCFLPGPSGQIEALWGDVDQAKACVLLCHPHPLHQGTMTHKILTTAVKVAREMSYATLRFNYRGVGQSEGEYGDIVGECDDASAAYAWLRQHYPDKPCYLFGFSFGAYIALKQASLQSSIHSTCLVAPSIAHGFYDTITPLPPKVWVFQGDADEVISVPDVRLWIKQHPEIRYQEHSGIGHFYHGTQHVLAAGIRQWLVETAA